MFTITIQKKEYQDLIDKKLRYEYLRSILEEDLFSPPPTRRASEVIKAFRTSKGYNRKFLESLARGLRRSSYFR